MAPDYDNGDLILTQRLTQRNGSALCQAAGAGAVGGQTALLTKAVRGKSGLQMPRVADRNEAIIVDQRACQALAI